MRFGVKRVWMVCNTHWNSHICRTAVNKEDQVCSQPLHAFLVMIAHSLRSKSMGLWIHFSLHMSEQKSLNHKGRKSELPRSTLEDRSKWFWETLCIGTEQNKLILTHDFAGFLVVQFLIPVQHSQKRKWGQQHQTDSQEHVTRKARKVNPLEEEEGG